MNSLKMTNSLNYDDAFNQYLTANKLSLSNHLLQQIVLKRTYTITDISEKKDTACTLLSFLLKQVFSK